MPSKTWYRYSHTHNVIIISLIWCGRRVFLCMCVNVAVQTFWTEYNNRYSIPVENLWWILFTIFAFIWPHIYTLHRLEGKNYLVCNNVASVIFWTTGFFAPNTFFTFLSLVSLHITMVRNWTERYVYNNVADTIMLCITNLLKAKI